jgi:hypothetical protein
MGRLLVEDYLREIGRLRRCSGSSIESVVSDPDHPAKEDNGHV